MSNLPPGGPPPPYDPWRPQGVAYVPTPVMMPMPGYPGYPTYPGYPGQPNHPGQLVHPSQQPQGQPTYITNIYQPTPNNPPEPVHVVEHAPIIVNEVPPLIDWVPATPQTASTLTGRAFVGGREGWDQSPLWIIRSQHSGECVPGKLAIKSGVAYIPFAGKEIPVHNFEVLCAPPHVLRWLPSRDGQVPVGAYPAGNTHSGEPLYVARVNHKFSTTPGKVHPSHRCAYISFGGQELSFKKYEVLCQIVG